jgi:hypothetical protein
MAGWRALLQPADGGIDPRVPVLGSSQLVVNALGGVLDLLFRDPQAGRNGCVGESRRHQLQYFLFPGCEQLPDRQLPPVETVKDGGIAERLAPLDQVQGVADVFDVIEIFFEEIATAGGATGEEAPDQVVVLVVGQQKNTLGRPAFEDFLLGRDPSSRRPSICMSRRTASGRSPCSR